jgi:hypothetical protein
MLDLTPQQISAYLQKSYTSVDGLWFMKAEDSFGFDKALDTDEAVWKVMPKIQARQMKQYVGGVGGLNALRECFEAKLSLDGFEFTTSSKEASFEIVMTRCPWYDKLVKSNRTHLAEKISGRICNAEYSGWAGEFGCSFSLVERDRICTGCPTCTLKFTEG